MNIAHDERAELLKAQVDSVHEEFDSAKGGDSSEPQCSSRRRINES